MLLRRSGCRSATAAEVLCVAASLATSLQEAQAAGSVTMSGEMADTFLKEHLHAMCIKYSKLHSMCHRHSVRMQLEQ